MSQFTFASIANMSLANLINIDGLAELPATFCFTETSVIVAQSALSAQGQGQGCELSNDSTSNQQDLQLVVFSDINISTLHQLCQACDLQVISIATVNHRVNTVSVRFDVTSDDIEVSRQKLASFNMEKNIEAALVKDAPVLNEPGLLVMDMDSTAIKIECIDEIAKLAGVGEQVAKVTEQAMQGKLDFKQSLYQRVATLNGADEAILQSVLNKLPLMEGLTELVAVLRRHNWRLAIASGGFTYFADYLKETLPLDAAFSNTLEIIDGKLTGNVLGDIVDANKKAQVLVSLAKKYQIDESQTVAIGDGANDLVMMAQAQLGVACHAKKIVKQKAQTSINKAPLHTLIHWLA